MKFTFLSLFPNVIKEYFNYSILKRAINRHIIDIEIINFREFSKDKHNKVDSPLIGGGAGMLISAEPLINAINNIKKSYSHIIFLTPSGKLFNQKDARRLSKYKHIVFICGKYEGIDERVVETCVDEVFCIGNYIITGGEIASLVVCDCISRNLDNVIGNPDSILSESFEHNLLEPPSFTKISTIQYSAPPSEYSKGNHRKINNLKYELSMMRTKYFRPDICK